MLKIREVAYSLPPLAPFLDLDINLSRIKASRLHEPCSLARTRECAINQHLLPYTSYGCQPAFACSQVYTRAGCTSRLFCERQDSRDSCWLDALLATCVESNLNVHQQQAVTFKPVEQEQTTEKRRCRKHHHPQALLAHQASNSSKLLR